MSFLMNFSHIYLSQHLSKFSLKYKKSAKAPV